MIRLLIIKSRVLIFAIALLASLILSGNPGDPREILAAPPQDTGPKQTNRALLIGINKYRNFHALRGAVNDIDSIRQLLATRYGFHPTAIHTLLDQEASRRAITAALKSLQEETGPEDVVYIHFSGYGSLLKSYRDDFSEPLVKETLVPYDGRTNDIPDLLLDEVREILDKFKSKSVILVTDTAHSVTTLKAGKVLSRAIAADTRPMIYRHISDGSGGTANSSSLMLLAAAGLRQAAIDGPVDGKYHGLFSYAIAKSLAANKTSASAKDILAGIERELKRVQTQLGLTSLPEPRLEAPADQLIRSLFAGPQATARNVPNSTDTRLAYVEIKPTGGNHVLLLKGQGFGALVGSSWALYPPGETEFPPGQANAMAIVTEIKGEDAVARVEPADAAIEQGSRAVIVAPPAPDSIPIRIQNMAPEKQERLQASLQQKLGNVTFVGQGDFARYVVDEQGDTVFVAGADGMTTVGAFPVSNDSILANNLSTLLSRSSNASTLVSLDNPSSRIQISARVASETTARSIALSSAETLNPDRSGKPLSLVVRLYQLTGKDKFQQATYQSLLKGDQKVLEGDLLAKSEVTLHPNSREMIKLDPRKEASYIGVMALFRDPQEQNWRHVIPIKDLASQSMDVAFEGNGILGVSREVMVAKRGVKLVANTSASRVRIKKDGEPRTPENSLQLAIQTNCDCYLTIVDVDAEGGVNLLFPNDVQSAKFYPKGKVRSGESILIPDSLIEDNRAGFHFDYSTPPGVDTIRIFASTDLETAEMIRRYAKNPTQSSTPKLEAGVAKEPPLVVASATLNDLKTGLRSRGVKVTKSKAQARPGTGDQQAASASPFGASEGSVMPVSLPGPDWTATSVTVVVDP